MVPRLEQFDNEGMEHTSRSSKLISATALAFGALALGACGAEFDITFGEDGEGAVETRVFEVDDFSAIDVNSFIEADIEIDPSQKASLSFTTNPNLFDNLNVEVTNGELRLSMSDVGEADEARAIIIVPSLDKLEAGGAVSVDVVGIRDDFEVEVNGAADVDASGASEIKRLTVDANGASSVDLSGVTAEYVDVDVDGASSVDITVSESVTGNVSGASDLDVEGDGEIDVVSSGAASVN